MQKEEIKEGALVCIYVDGRPHINTTVTEFPIQRGWARGDTHALLKGIENPMPIKELRPFNRGYRYCDDLRTSAEWHREEFAMYKIVDPDGWDRSNFDYSWYIERISATEFTTRMANSTVQPVKLFGR